MFNTKGIYSLEIFAVIFFNRIDRCVHKCLIDNCYKQRHALGLYRLKKNTKARTGVLPTSHNFMFCEHKKIEEILQFFRFATKFNFDRVIKF